MNKHKCPKCGIKFDQETRYIKNGDFTYPMVNCPNCNELIQVGERYRTYIRSDYVRYWQHVNAPDCDYGDCGDYD